MGWELAGRFFDPNLQTDQENSVMMNGRLLQEMGWKTGVNKVVRYEKSLYNIVGVVEDFHHFYTDRAL